MFVWGARTREEARGRGLAALLMQHVEAHSLESKSSPLARWLLSITIPSNSVMRRLFGRLGYGTLCQVDIWPR